MFGFEIVPATGGQAEFWQAESTAIRWGKPLWGPGRYAAGVILRGWKAGD